MTRDIPFLRALKIPNPSTFGHAENIGKSAFASESIFRYLREVDYVSGAALFISNKDFQILDGFDSRFSPAYYEDTSLCMDIRKNLGKSKRSDLINVRGEKYWNEI